MFRSCGEAEVGDAGRVVAAEVDFVAVAVFVVPHVVVEVAVDDDGAEFQDDFGPVGGPSRPGNSETFQQSLSGRVGACCCEGACVVGVCFAQRLEQPLDTPVSHVVVRAPAPGRVRVRSRVSSTPRSRLWAIGLLHELAVDRPGGFQFLGGAAKALFGLEELLIKLHDPAGELLVGEFGEHAVGVDVLAQTPPAAASQPATGQPFSTEQLDALVASIALYPDDLLTQLLMASTFPLEVVAAARWVEDPAHKSLTGDALVKALEAESWDPSVKSLVPFPVVLATLNSNLTWLQQLGYAFATQQADVFAAVQRLRRLAQANDKLQSSPQQVVSTQQVTVEPPAGSSQPPTQQEVIVIEPAQSDTVYVPSYDPASGVRLVMASSRLIRRTTRSSRPATISAPCWPPGWHSRPAPRLWAGCGAWRVPGGAAATRTSTSTDTTTSTPIGRRSIQTVGALAPGAGGPAISPAHPADLRGSPAARKSPYPGMQ